MQDSDDSDVAVAEPSPIDKVVLVAEEPAVDAERGRDLLRGDLAGFDPVEGSKRPVT
jgi:hypothetical protein